MNKKIRDIVLLKSIIDAMDMIALHQRSSHPDYTINRAVVYELVIIGEACTQISKVLRDKHPEIEWAIIVAARNKMVHGYLEIDYDTVWDIVENHLPDLRANIEVIIRQEEGK